MTTPVHTTPHGAYYLGAAEDLLQGPLGEMLRGQVQLLLTSPPFALNRKKSYGNLQEDAYYEWFVAFAPLVTDLLTPDGSIVIEMGNAWTLGRPVQSLLPYEALMGFARAADLVVCQQFIAYNPARMPGPAQWVTVKRIRCTDSYTHLWWMSRTDTPKADSRNIPASPSTLEPPLVPNMLRIAHTHSNDFFLRTCRERKITPHPARMPAKIPAWFIPFLTDPGDLVLDPFAGSNTTGYVAETLGRRWVSLEQNADYAEQSRIRFADPALQAVD